MFGTKFANRGKSIGEYTPMYPVYFQFNPDLNKVERGAFIC